MNLEDKMNMYHFSDEISALSRDFYHTVQNDIIGATELEYTFEEWIPLFLKFVQERIKENTGITATSPEFKTILENAKPWDSSLPSRWSINKL